VPSTGLAPHKRLWQSFCFLERGRGRGLPDFFCAPLYIPAHTRASMHCSYRYPLGSDQNIDLREHMTVTAEQHIKVFYMAVLLMLNSARIRM
jgi:hypothetical protein